MEYGLIGEKLSHSFSKIIHGQISDYDYSLKEIAKDELEGFMRNADFKGINVTIPYKQDVIRYLDEIYPAAKKIGAVNTVVNRGGKLIGYNTDFYGLSALIRHAKVNLEGKKVLILGSGGTSKTAAAVAESMNAATVLKVSRTGGEGLITYHEAESFHTDCDVIINTTPCGMYPKIGVAAINIYKFSNLSGVIDVVYNPLSTALITNAKKRGIKAEGGLYMLVAQAVFSAEKFLDKSFDLGIIDSIYEKILRRERNIVLIGMPSSGKSTIGKALAKELGKDYFDSDEEIVKLCNMQISEIFESFGEEHFRELESLVISNLSLKQNAVIATGGGSVLNNRNVDLLRENGTILFLDRPLEELVATNDRPLSNTAEAVKKRYEERYEIYKESADITLKIGKDLEKNISLIKEVLE